MFLDRLDIAVGNANTFADQLELWGRSWTTGPTSTMPHCGVLQAACELIYTRVHLDTVRTLYTAGCCPYHAVQGVMPHSEIRCALVQCPSNAGPLARAQGSRQSPRRRPRQGQEVATRRGFVTALDLVPPMFASGTSDSHHHVPSLDVVNGAVNEARHKGVGEYELEDFITAPRKRTRLDPSPPRRRTSKTPL